VGARADSPLFIAERISVYPGAFAPTTPDKPAVVMGSGAMITYKELDDRSAQLAQLLYARGLRRGDHVAILAENHVRYFETYWAALRSGLYLTAVNRYSKPDEAAYLVNDSGAVALIATAAMRATASALVELAPECTIRLMIEGTAPGFESYEAAIAEFPAEPLGWQPKGEVMLYSSGTTGRPKGIERPLRDFTVDDPAAGGTSSVESALLGMHRDSVYMCPAPLYHAAGLQWSAGAHEMGATLVVMEKFDAETFLQIVDRERVTHVQVVPTMLVRLMKLDEPTRLKYDVSSLKSVVHAAAPCPIDIKRQVIDWLGPIVDEYYAATEGVGFTFIKASDWLTHPGSVGLPMMGVPHICDEEGNELPANEPGTLYFSDLPLSFKYHGDDSKTKSTRHPTHDDWASLGDVGYLDEEGYLYLTDRRAFTIISGGVNIYPAEIESCLVDHPSVLDAAVFGLPDPEMGEYVHAVIQPANGVAPTTQLAEELRGYVRVNLANFKVPRVIDFVEELPRMPSGKLAKGPLRDEYRIRRAAG
jgi:long-chain acyl-CoA synthetase